MTILEGQIAYRTAKIQKWSAIITSGAYKLCGYKKFDHTPFTDDEKLAQALGILDNHIDLLGELVDQLE